MLKEKVTIVNKLGLHARAAAKFVSCASRYSSEIFIEYNHRRINGKSIMGVMLLAASKGAEIELQIEGEDAQEAKDDLAQLIHDRFGEDE